MLIIKYKHIFAWITGVFLLLSVGAIGFFGINFGVDFTGGTLLEVQYEGERPSKEVVEGIFENLGLPDSSVRASGDQGFIVRTSTLTDEQRGALTQALSINESSAASIERFTEVGPTIGEELRNKAFIALALVSVAIILYVAFTFRHVSKPISSWVYGLIAIAALIHDILIPTGVFAAMGYFLGTQADTLFVMALLAILGYSVNDTIVVFDRVRENLRINKERGRKEEFALTVGKSLNQTFTRSINTSLTTLLVLLALFFLGPIATQDFALTLIVGVLAGTYSSLAFATPLLVFIAENTKEKKK